MLALGLTSANYKIYLATLAAPHDIKITVQILDNQHAVKSTVTAILLDGQVDGTSPKKDGVSRTCTLQFLDPKRSMTFDSDSPTDGAMYLDRMIRVIYSVRCSFGWVDVPVFTGPVAKCDRDGDIVNVEAQGKESFGLGAAFNTATYKGYKTDAIKGLLGRSGESSKYWAIPVSKSRLTTAVTVGRESKLWEKAYNVGTSMNWILVYNGRGIADAGQVPTKAALSIRSGNGGLLMSDPQISFSTDDLINIVQVIGGKPKGSKTVVSWVQHAPNSHPLNPWKIGRNGKPRYLLLVEENPDLRSKAAVGVRAKTLLAQKLMQQIELTYTCLPIPHAEPFDIATVKTDHFNMSHRVYSFSLPLRHDANMTIGYTARLAKPRRVVRRA